METTMKEKIKVLHLEDTPSDAALVQRMLAAGGLPCEFAVVDDEAAFQSALAGGRFDIILSDQNLPDYDGFQALQLVREKYPHIPFIFVTGSMGEEGAIETIKAGASDYLLKDRLSRLSTAVERAIHESRQAEKIRQTEEKNREQAALIDTAQDAIVVKDLEDRILFWNKSAERVYGWAASEIVGSKVAVVLAKDLAKHEEAQERLLEEGNWTGELAKVNRLGNDLIVESRWTLVRDAKGQPKSILVIDTDITAKKSVEAQFLHVQRLQSIGVMASGIAHDLNNCLAPILMGVALLRDLDLDPSLKNILTAMEASAARGAGVVKQVLTFARGTPGGRVALQPNDLIQEMVKIIRETFPRSIQIKAECAPNLWSIESDATQFHQVLLNLCVNARDAMPDGGTLTLTSSNVNLTDPSSLAGLSGPPGPYVRIDVKDTGAGIPPDIQQKIFQPFFTTKEVGKGTGLGLSTVVSILANHHGLLGLQSLPNNGTTFSLYFPATAASVEAERPPPSGHVRKGRQDLILLVDDEAAIREMCKFILESSGYRVLNAENGSQALALFARHKDELALVVCDSNMPVMGGSTAVRFMRAAAPQMKILSTSGAAMPEEDIRAADPKLHRFLAKPYTVESLLRLIGELLPRGDTQFLCRPG
jgi:two-component system, cell cycle sensor histidine kinase and response regulator CckA